MNDIASKLTSNIEVTSTIVKKVQLEHTVFFLKFPYIKYRYFFDMNNTCTKDFEGVVTIGLYREIGKLRQLGRKAFKVAIPAGRHKVVWVDLYTGPVSTHGEYGAAHFDWMMQVEGDETVNGQGLITSKYEDLS